MRTESINIYKFAELSEESQEKALNHLRYVNVEHDWWEFQYEDLKTLCKLIGIDVDLKKTYFRGFYSQGDGSAFTADVDVTEVISGIAEQKWKTEFPTLELNFGKLNVDRRVLCLIADGVIDVRADIKTANRETAVTLEYSADFNWNECTNYNRIESELEKLESWLDDVMETLNGHFFKRLRDEYDYQTSDEAVKESIEANEYEFTEDGEQY
jgi:hypothetical protein